MFVSHRIINVFSLVAATLAVTVAVSRAESVQGRIRSIARDADLLSLQIDREKLLLVNWDSGTAWKNLKAPAELRVDDMLAVDYAKNGDQALARNVSLLLPTTPAGMKVVTVEAMAAHLDKKAASRPFTLIDVRPADRFEAAHLAGAVSVPLRRIEKSYAGILPEDRTAPLVFYDEGAGDGSAAKAAELSVKAGYADVAVFPEGASGWVRSGRFLASSGTFLRKGGGIIIDLRRPELVAAGHIDRAASIPAAKLGSSHGLFPMERRVPIVVYGENDAEALAAAGTIRNWGYRQVTIYSGGVAAWLESAEVLTTEKADEFIHFSATSKGGPLKGRDFEMALISPITVQIVDVRSDGDHARGHFPKSVHIPLQQLSARHGELDKEMIQVIFGADETQAEIAADFLKQKDYRINYLQGRVEFQGEGKYQIR